MDSSPRLFVLQAGQVSFPAYTNEHISILFKPAPKKIDDNVGDVWNSEQVRRNASFNIMYKGLPLKQGHTY